MMRAVVTLFIVLGVIATCRADCDTQTFLQGKFQRCHTLNAEYDLYWTVTGSDVIIGLNLRGYANPWLGLGISVNGGMMGGDIALARPENGNYTLEDRFATEFDTPQLDKLQNLELISASSIDQNTIIIYKRKLVSCDVDQDQAILANATQVIFAYGVGSFTYHGPNHRGTAIIFFHFEPVVQNLPATFGQVNVTMPPYEMPAQDTTYTCVSFVLPKDNKYHIVRWRPIIANPKHIHHMVLFGCYFDANTTVPYECPMAPSSAGCANVMIAWTIGQTGNDFLGEYALPMGANTTAATYVVLQVHYNNPQRLAGVVDTSGLQLIYSTELRKYDIGTVPMSVPWANGFLVLPPGKKEVLKYTRCHSECTSKSIPAEGITMINWFPHMHQYGSKIWLTHIRNGAELPEIHRDNNYDFERQQNFPVYRRILPGDSLIMNCVWDTSGVTTAIYGGESSSEEMCIGIFQYFPATTPPAFTRCTDLHDYLNTTGNDASYSTCTKNNGTAINPINNLPFSGGVTNVIANPAYTALSAPKSTCLKGSASTLSATSIISVLLVIVLCML